MENLKSSLKQELIAFGKKIRRRRRDLDLTQEQIAERAGFHPSYWGLIERGTRNVTFEKILAIAKALKCSPKDLMPD